MGKRPRSGSMSGSASAKKRYRRGRYVATRRYRPQYVRPGYGLVGRTPGGAVLGEMKYFDTAVNQSIVPNLASWVGSTIDPSPYNTLCVPVVGAAFNQRIGKEINIVKLKIRGQFVLSGVEASGIAQQPIVIRYGIFQDMQTNATQAGGNLVMTPVTNASQVPFTFQNIDNFGRFKVLKDKQCIIQDPNLVGSDTVHDMNGKTVCFKMTVKFYKPIQVRFNQTNGGTVADIIDNSLHFYANCNSTGTLIPSVTYLSRVCYKE